MIMYNIIDLYKFTIEQGLKQHSDFIMRVLNDKQFAEHMLLENLHYTRDIVWHVSYMFSDCQLNWAEFRYDLRDRGFEE